MAASPAPQPAGGDEVPAGRVAEPSGWEPVITCPDPLTRDEWLASVDATAAEDEPWWLGALAAMSGRRGPGQPGSAQSFPGDHDGRAAQFASAMLFDVTPGCPGLAQFADAAAGEDDSFDSVSDDELLGVLCAWDRVESHAAAREYAAIAELVRRRPAAGYPLEGEARMPEAWDEFATDLAGAASENPRSTWCVTVTDQDGHAIGHGCAKPESRDHARARATRGTRGRPGQPCGPGLACGPGPPRGVTTAPPGFTFTTADGHGPPGTDGDSGYGTWRLATGIPGQRDLIVTLDPIATDSCDHRFQARGHDPGSGSGT